MKMKKIKIDYNILTILLIIAIIVSLFIVPGLFEEKTVYNTKPVVEIIHPGPGDVFSNFVTVSGTAMDPDGNQTLKRVEVLINDTWYTAEGTTSWKYTWNVFNVENGYYIIGARAWDGAVYSDIVEVKIEVYNHETVVSDAHKWALFIVAANFPDDDESKLGNGGFYLVEEMAEYFIENYKYPTSNVFILFDDGWIRADNGMGRPIKTLQQRYHTYDITYEGATRENVESVINHIVNEANKFDDSEVFIYISSHGFGDSSDFLTGGKVLERSGIFLWGNEIITDKELGDLLSNLNAKKTCILVDACYSGGFADKTILNFPEIFLFRSGLARPGRVVITGASKFRVGYASTRYGPLFSLLWFQGIKSGEADGFRPGLLKTGRPPILSTQKDGKVSVEEAFYYARYILRNDENLEDYSHMQPQINDMYPNRGLLRSRKGLVLG
jgi:hypothetical protein